MHSFHPSRSPQSIRSVHSAFCSVPNAATEAKSDYMMVIVRGLSDSDILFGFPQLTFRNIILASLLGYFWPRDEMGIWALLIASCSGTAAIAL